MVFNWAAVGACLLPNIGSWVNAYRNRDSIDGWYKMLKKPSWTPPDFVLMLVWTCLYTGMGYASYLVWRDAGKSFGGAATLPLTLYAVQLVLIWAWSEIFFGRHDLKLGFYDLLLVFVVALACSSEFCKVNHSGGWLMAPYLGWLLFDSALNYRIYKDNPVVSAWRK